jgi:hypothetical protein
MHLPVSNQTMSFIVMTITTHHLSNVSCICVYQAKHSLFVENHVSYCNGYSDASCVKCIIYPQDPSDSPFVDDHLVNDAGQAVGVDIIDDFARWGEASLRHFNYDHAALLTG